MALSDLAVIGNIVKFDTYANELGTSFSGVQVAATHSYTTAKRQRDVDAVHQQIYSRLPAGTPNDPRQYTYVEIIAANGDPVILGIPWIKAATVSVQKTLIYKPSIVVTSSQDVILINQVLAQAGWTEITSPPLIDQ